MIDLKVKIKEQCIGKWKTVGLGKERHGQDMDKKVHGLTTCNARVVGWGSLVIEMIVNKRVSHGSRRERVW